MSRTIEEELQDYLDRLPEEEQLQVLAYARSLASKKLRGRRGSDLRHFAGTISKADLDLIDRAIEKDCERVDRDEW